MSYTTEKSNEVYGDLLNSCRHSRLRSAMAAHQPPVYAPATLIMEAPEYVVVARTTEPSVSATSKAYLTVAGMSVISMLSVVVSGAINA